MSVHQQYATRFGCICRSCGSATTRRRGDVRLCPSCRDDEHAADADERAQ